MERVCDPDQAIQPGQHYLSDHDVFFFKGNNASAHKSIGGGGRPVPAVAWSNRPYQPQGVAVALGPILYYAGGRGKLQYLKEQTARTGSGNSNFRVQPAEPNAHSAHRPCQPGLP